MHAKENVLVFYIKPMLFFSAFNYQYFLLGDSLRNNWDCENPIKLMRMKRQDFAQSGLYGINHSISFFTLRLEHSPLVATKSSCLLSSISYTKMQAHTNTGSGTQDDLSSQADNCFNNYMIFFITMMNQHSLDISAMCIGHLGALFAAALETVLLPLPAGLWLLRDENWSMCMFSAELEEGVHVLFSTEMANSLRCIKKSSMGEFKQGISLQRCIVFLSFLFCFCILWSTLKNL